MAQLPRKSPPSHRTERWWRAINLIFCYRFSTRYIALGGLFFVACAHGQNIPDAAPVPEEAPRTGSLTEAASTKVKPLVVVHVNGPTGNALAHSESDALPPQSALSSEACERVDINMANEKALVSLPGIGPSKANAIVTYRDRNGRFISVDSLTAVPGIGAVTLEKLRPFLLAGPNTAAPSPHSPSKDSDPRDQQSEKININTGSAEDLMKLRGVGPKTAARIIAYREMHGAFLSLEALTEVKGIGPKTLAKLRPNIEVLVDINQATAAEFEALGFNNGAKIVERRKNRGDFKGAAKLKRVPGTDKQLVNRLRSILR